MSRPNLGNVEDNLRTGGEPEWNVQAGQYDVSKAVEEIYFVEEISDAGEFDISILANPGDIGDEDEVFVDRTGDTAFKGVVKKPENTSRVGKSVSGMGPAGIIKDVPVTDEFIGSNTDDIVESVFNSVSSSRIAAGGTGNGGVNERLNSNNGEVDARADDEGALSFLNRVVTSHGGEWYVTYNEQDDVFVFNVESEVRSGSVERTFTGENTIEIAEAQIFEEQYDGVVVKGYGDGEDQIRGEYPDRTNWPDDPKVLVYTDKTILSEEEATNTAENIYNEHTDWRNIFVIPASENEVLDLGDEVDVDETNSGVSGTYRVVRKKLNVKFGSSRSSVEYVLSDRPIGILDSQEGVKEQTDSQTDYSQGNRNTINESNEDVSDKDNGTKVEFNIPDKFTEDIKNKDQTKGVFLDFSVDDYKQLIKASNADAVNDETSAVPTEVSNFGDVETQLSKERPSANSDLNKENTAGFQNVVGGGQSQGLSYTADDGNFVEGAQFTTDDTDIEGIYISVSLISNDENIETQVDPAQDEALYIRPTDIDGDGDLEDVYLATDDGDSETFLTESDVLNDDEDRRDVLVPGESKNGNNSTEIISFYAEVNDTTIYPNDGAGQGLDIKDWTSMGAHGELTADFDLFIPGNKKNSKIELQFANLTFGTSGSADGEVWTGFYTYYTVEKIQTPNADNSNDNVQAYVAKSTGSGNLDYDNLDASVNSNQNSQQLVNNNTTTFGQLDENDLVLNRKTTTADQVRILLNGTEIDGSPYSLDTSNNPPYKQGDIELTGDSSATLNKPGFNTVEIIPENSTDTNDGAKSYVKGNVIVDHKIESERE